MMVRRHVCIDKEAHESYKSLTEGKSAPFRSMKDVFLISMVLGFRSELHKPINQKQDIFQWPVFNSDEDVPTIQAVAIAHTHGVAVLGNPEEVLSIAEGYANGGIGQIREAVLGRPGLPLDNLVTFLLDADDTKDPIVG